MEVTAPMLADHAVAAFVPSFGTASFVRYEDCLSGLNDPDLMAMGARYFETPAPYPSMNSGMIANA